jgi:hypothetical protein
MKVAVIADIHDNLTNLERCLDLCRENNIENIICCGDVTNSETLGYISDHFKGRIMLVRGNMEIYGEQEIANHDNIDYGDRVGYFEVGNKIVGVCHEPFLVDKILERKDCYIVFYGHTHRPWEETRDGVRIVNPGTLGGVFSRPTYAVWDTETGEMEMKFIS